MDDENDNITGTGNEEVVPVTETETPPEPEKSATVEPEPESKEDDTPKVPAWLQRRIDKEVREKHDLRRRLADAERAKADAEASRGKDGLPEEEVERRATTKAQELAQRRQFDNECNATVDQAEKTNPKFSGQFDALREELGQLPLSLALALNAEEDGGKVLAYLADPKHRDEASEIYDLPPVKQAQRVAKLAIKITAPPPPKPVSKAADPITPVGGSKPAPGGALTDDLSDDEWFRRRNKADEERFAARRR